MKINRESVHHYVRMMQRREYFTFAGYSDAEWRCVLGGEWAGTVTALGQVIDPDHGALLADVLVRRAGNPSFLVAVPRCLWAHEADHPDGTPGSGRFVPGLPGFAEGQVDWWLGRKRLHLDGWERDDVLDDLAARGGLFPWLREFRRHRVLAVGPEHLRRLPGDVLAIDHLVPVTTPNLHREPGGIDAAVAAALRWLRTGLPAGHTVCVLVSAGVSAAVICDRLHHAVVDCKLGWVLDMGSTWDAFVREGGQRAWRAELYADEARYKKWLNDCLFGIDGRGW